MIFQITPFSTLKWDDQMGNIILRKFKEEDIQQVLDILNRNFEQHQHIKFVRDIAWWQWKYEKNIFGKPIIYVAEKNEGLVGVRAFWPWQLTMGNKKYECYQPVDSVVDKHYRGKGIFTKLTQKIFSENQQNIDLVYNFPNRNSLNANLRMGWTFVSNLKWFVKINRPFSSILLLKNFTNLDVIELESEDRISKGKIEQVKFTLDSNKKLKTEKNSEFLTWRYLQHPLFKYGMFHVGESEKKLWLVYSIHGNRFGKEIVVVDSFGDYNKWNLALKKINKIAKKYRVSHTMILENPRTPVYLFYQRLYFKIKQKNFVVLPLNFELESFGLEYNNWEMFLGMHDSI